MNVSQGQTGADVVSVQQALTGVGFPVAADGIYGPNTAGAVQQFQTVQGLPVTGIVDDITWGALQNVLGQRAYATSLVPAPAVTGAPTAAAKPAVLVSTGAAGSGLPTWLTTPAMLTFLGVALAWAWVKWGRD